MSRLTSLPTWRSKLTPKKEKKPSWRDNLPPKKETKVDTGRIKATITIPQPRRDKPKTPKARDKPKVNKAKMQSPKVKSQPTQDKDVVLKRPKALTLTKTESVGGAKTTTTT